MRDAVVVTYRVADEEEPLEAVAADLAVVETTGAWPGAGDGTELFKRCMGSVVDVREEAPGAGEVDLALPLENFSLQSPFTDLYMEIATGYAPAKLTFREAQIRDVKLPPALLERFPGPVWGAERLRERMRESVGPGLLVGTIVKPVSGLTPAEVAADLGAAAAAGIAFVKDDQKMLNPAYCPLKERVEAVIGRFAEIEQETGRRRPLYAPNITTRPDRLLANAEVALAAGAEALMVNFMAAGFPALEILATALLDMPVYAHCGGKETMTRVPGQGVDVALVGLLARLCGADMMRISAPQGDLLHSDPPTVERCLEAMVRPLDGIAPMLGAVSGGLHADNLSATLQVCGDDVLVLAGRGIAKHPGGMGAGVRALRDAAAAWAEAAASEYSQRLA